MWAGSVGELLNSDTDLVSYIEYNQLQIMGRVHRKSKEKLEQYFTPASVAKLMVSIFEFNIDNVKILDPGAGAGILFTAVVNEILRLKIHIKSISVLAFEADFSLKGVLQLAMEACGKACKSAGIEFSGQLRMEDFIESTVKERGLYDHTDYCFTHIIMNPPYKKLNIGSYAYKLLKSLGKQSPNLYTAFLSLAETYLTEKGQLVSITPRSFCNGVYFKDFRKRFLFTMHISVIHLFTSRTKAFSIDSVLQENIIIKWVKSPNPNAIVKILSSEGPEDTVPSQNEVLESDVVDPNDHEHIIKIVQDNNEELIRKLIDNLPCKLNDLTLKASTGPVVDFRFADKIHREKKTNSIPLIRPECISSGGYVVWDPSAMKKSPYIELSRDIKKILVQDDIYVFVKRFTSNEERKRIVASVYLPIAASNGLIGIENRVNYLHLNGKGMDISLAKGLALYLNSTIVDSYFRQMSGHTQVNAFDLERLKYPDIETLKSLGNEFGDKLPAQGDIDDIIKKRVFFMSGSENENDPIDVKKRIGEALEILKVIGMPREQQNERSALTLLALLNLKPMDPWSKASDPLIGITPMMKFFEDYYGKKYAPNSRETVRRFTVHQFCQAHLVIENPDDPTRPTNSPKAVYQIDSKALELIRNFGSIQWDSKLKAYLKDAPPLDNAYRGIQNNKRIKISVSPGINIDMSPGGQNVLVEKIVSLFVPRFINNPRILYIGDAENKFLHFDEDGFKSINVDINLHGKIPDIIILDQDMKWLYLIEAVTSHGPINKKRRNELEEIFGRSTAGLVYVTAFPDRSVMVKYLKEISWQSDVWLAETPDHMIHFNGDRFLGPYD